MREYYELTAFFNNIDESGLYSHFTAAVPTPTMLLYEGDQKARHEAARAGVKQAEAALQVEVEKARGRFENTVEISAVPVKAPEPVAAFDFNDGKASGGNRAVEGREGLAIEFSGDDPHALGDEKLGAFSRTQPFSFSLWLKPSEHKERMVVFHRSRAAEDSAFRGYELMLCDGRPTFSLVHFWPGNALRVESKEPLPLNQWTHLVVTYDGSSRAGGVQIYRDGKAEPELELVRDKLTRDIGHRQQWGDSGAGKNKLQLAGRFRDVGFGGGTIDEFAIFDRELSSLEASVLAGIAPSNPSGADAFAHFVLHHDEAVSIARQKAREAREAEDAVVSGVREIMTMMDEPGQRPAYLLSRGAYDQRGEEVGPNTPSSVLPFPEDAPRNRLGLAGWLTDEANPLVARVAVNRLWMLAFGNGLVGTPEDFGSQGELPTHPELLDWMSREFIASGWDVKRALKQIVLSATYRQSSIPEDSKTWSEDPENRWLARGPRHRLPAEVVRDNALAVSGLLVEKQGGPSVNPYELAVSFKPQSPSKGEGLYRRSLYTFWKRTAPPPVMVTFDATAREVCSPIRENTATPLQALVLLNGPQYVEAAKKLAERLLRELPGEASDVDRLVYGFRLCTSRRPNEAELKVMCQLLEEQRALFHSDPEAAGELLEVGSTPADADLLPAELAAWSVTAQALLNYDETYTKR